MRALRRCRAPDAEQDLLIALDTPDGDWAVRGRALTADDATKQMQCWRPADRREWLAYHLGFAVERASRCLLPKPVQPSSAVRLEARVLYRSRVIIARRPCGNQVVAGRAKRKWLRAGMVLGVARSARPVEPLVRGEG